MEKIFSLEFYHKTNHYYWLIDGETKYRKKKKKELYNDLQITGSAYRKNRMLDDAPPAIHNKILRNYNIHIRLIQIV